MSSFAPSAVETGIFGRGFELSEADDALKHMACLLIHLQERAVYRRGTEKGETGLES